MVRCTVDAVLLSMEMERLMPAACTATRLLLEGTQSRRSATIAIRSHPYQSLFVDRVCYQLAQSTRSTSVRMVRDVVAGCTDGSLRVLHLEYLAQHQLLERTHATISCLHAGA